MNQFLSESESRSIFSELHVLMLYSQTFLSELEQRRFENMQLSRNRQCYGDLFGMMRQFCRFEKKKKKKKRKRHFYSFIYLFFVGPMPNMPTTTTQPWLVFRNVDKEMILSCGKWRGMCLCVYVCVRLSALYFVKPFFISFHSPPFSSPPTGNPTSVAP